MTVIPPHFGRFIVCVVFASALALPGARLAAETGEPGGSAGSDPSKRLEWLKAHAPVAVAAPKPAVPKVKFRANPVAPSPVTTQSAPAEARPAEAPAEARPAKPSPSEAPSIRTSSGEIRIAKATPAVAPKPVAVVAPVTSRTAEARSTPAAKPRPAPGAAATPAPESRVARATPSAPAKATPPAIVAAPAPAKARTAETAATPAPKTKPTPTVVQVPPPTKPTPTAVVVAPKPTPPPIALAPTPARVRTAEVRSTPAPKPTPALVVASIQPPKTQPARGALFGSTRNVPDNRYPWKTDIVTTIFWIGEPVGGNNFVPNYASSWDPHWTQAYGGFDTPDTNARRNYIPVKFVPKQNPFYVALPYNDVTHGTTKPESRLVIPWFKEAFEREGASVCRDRWVAIRNRAGRVAYAQWSDCGPFRTDHWQYVFGNEKPKPNLNKGAGLDVSPAVRDFLGLGSTDVTDWKFVDAKDVPGGPWALYGDNNLLVRRSTQPQNNTAKQISKPAANATQVRVSKL